MTKKLETVGQLFLDRVHKSSFHQAVGHFDGSQIRYITYRDYKKVIQSLAMAFKEAGVISGQKVAILSNTRKEWHYCDLGIMTARGVTIPIYHTYTGEEIKYIFKHSDSKILVVENDELLKKVLKVQGELDGLTHMILLDQVSTSSREQIKSDITVYTFDEFLKLGDQASEKDPEFFQNNIKAQTGDEVASIIYTSGTTGEPKGVVITHEGFTVMLENVRQIFGGSLNEKDRTLTWLPLSHVFGRCESMFNLMFGWEMVFSRGIDHLIDDLAEVKPTILMSVPRIFEKIYAKIMDQVEAGSPVKKAIFKWADKTLTHYHDKLSRDLSPSPVEVLQAKAAYNLVFKKIYNRFGGRVRYFISGGAPIAVEIIKFLKNANLIIIEGYGLTETVAPCTANPTEKQIPGTVGIPIGDVEIKIADDGEILIKSKALLREYYKNPEATAESIKEGWFYSGDIGEFTPEGHLKITDRKKDLIITSGGKNIAPQKIENMLKLQRHISHPVIIGDRQKYLTALIGIEKESFAQMEEELGDKTLGDFKAIATNAKVHDLIESDIANVNKDLASFETVKNFYIVPEEFTVDNGFVTPSLKVRKKNVIKAYQGEIDKMYSVPSKS
ncbi:MAG: long-chain fatty acid--CoA ligase [Bacteriovoracales bacterium]|nr:long-chain fatty acid--CoA ligase [Bacteriovoracales bacterium]